MVFLVTTRACGLKIVEILRATLRAVFDVVAVEGVGMLLRQVLIDLPIAAGLFAEASASLKDFVAPYAHILAGQKFAAVT